MDDESWLTIALKIAERSPHRRFRTGAVICDRRGDILSVGWAHRNGTRRKLYSVHAELHALTRLDRTRLENGTVYVATIGRTGTQKLSAPCADCVAVLGRSGLSRAVYTLTIVGFAEFALDHPPLLKRYKTQLQLAAQAAILS